VFFANFHLLQIICRAYSRMLQRWMPFGRSRAALSPTERKASFSGTRLRPAAYSEAQHNKAELIT
jgi:hypothetical protein